MVVPNQANHYGTLFGGEALRLMDMAAFVAASRHARKPVMTASSEKIDFHVPVRQGQLAEVIGRVSRAGRTSMTVEVELWAEDLLTGARQLCTKGSFVLVAVDERGRPVPIRHPAA
jgi:acyl-CoA hydrolase